MPYLNPENENKKAKEYFDNNKNRITDCFHRTIPYFDEVRFFFSEGDETPYLAIVLHANCPWESGTPQMYHLEETIEGIMKSFRAFPHLTHAPIYLLNIFDFVILKRNDNEESGFEKLLWTYDLVVPNDEYGA
ncbi:hypothetical protein F5Y06DRAFT_302197 [Hypoxylon sp. FL0890]|nr:hypothetical protein F5Y06DRAFT_302197 [Hypoxylon sp. FL0890]